jgi:hypothetical protein
MHSKTKLEHFSCQALSPYLKLPLENVYKQGDQKIRKKAPKIKKKPKQLPSPLLPNSSKLNF